MLVVIFLKFKDWENAKSLRALFKDKYGIVLPKSISKKYRELDRGHRGKDL